MIAIHGTNRPELAPDRFVTDDDRWIAVQQHNPAADSEFYYSVSTTGVYCRPSCGARRPHRKNVRFHENAADAKAAGFRPCKRCRPDGLSNDELHISAIAGACREIERADVAPRIEELAASAGMSPFYFRRVFKKITGLTPKVYASAHRAQRARESLSQGVTVVDAIYDSGFNSSGRFYATTSQSLGMTPTEFRSGGPGTLIRFAVGECSLGTVLVAATEKGVCAISLGEDPDTLVSEFQERFQKAELIGGDPEFEHTVARVIGFIETPDLGLDLPLDIRGTVFQQRVWRALSGIPIGSTATYAEIAAKIGSPAGSRAVARACAANLLAVAISCHRVVRKDGAVSGYRWGVARKQALLERETRTGFRPGLEVTKDRPVER